MSHRYKADQIQKAKDNIEKRSELIDMTRDDTPSPRRIPSSKKTLEELRDSIVDEIPFVDIKPYSHNIIGMTLNIMAGKFGRKAADDAIKELSLEELGWKVEE